MKKLKHKVFWVIFSILTIFLISILGIFNYQSYEQEKQQIENNLTRMQDEKMKDNGGKFENSKNNSNFLNQLPEEEFSQNNMMPPQENENNFDLRQRIFMDSNVYTVLLDSNNQVLEVISHTENGMNESEIQEIASNILKNESNSIKKIGNLYFDNYSYSFQTGKSLTIVDNTTAKEKIVSLFKSSIAIFIFLEILIIFVSKQLTSWMIKPVIATFEKQKQFIADASHELKTPIAVILASSEALEKDYDPKWTQNIKSEAERMSRLVTNLLDLAKLENGANKEQYTNNNLSKTVEISVLTLESLIYEKNIKLNYDIEENITFQCHNDQIKQLMAILLDNAIKHSQEQGEIKVTLKKVKNEILLQVINKGEGIPRGSEEKIFERFYRVDEARNRNENRYGLGLAIAKNIVENHGGKITAKSENGYTTFQVRFK